MTLIIRYPRTISLSLGLLASPLSFNPVYVEIVDLQTHLWRCNLTLYHFNALPLNDS